MTGPIAFGPFTLDVADRRLARDGVPVEVGARYFDALALMAGRPGALVTKDEFIATAWKGVPVTDEALTQGMRQLRRLLGDDAARPTYIETVPKHGYRFIAPVRPVAPGPAVADPAAPAPAPPTRLARVARCAAAGTIGAGLAALPVGILYGALASAGGAALSTLLVIALLAMVAAMVSAAGIAVGIAAADLDSTGFSPLSIAGGMAGGLVAGGFLHLVVRDSFALLLGAQPGGLPGGMEGALIGAGIGAGLALAWRRRRAVAPAALAGLAGGMAGALAALGLGGTLLGGAIDGMLAAFPAAPLSLDPLGRALGEAGFGPRARLAGALVEGAALGAGLAAGLARAARRP